ncbi:hypothetical protein C8F04DRAFT_64422 [Mycena alexandri]|uniref:Uncharacterized protein n=1 Tax=Mycena alexandri TaxID=1745969 RepID=A0AAD6WYS4_9AGAR|nr:hypothetical protein C8F04DRAFT_64422 [Mycena alexandri]
MPLINMNKGGLCRTTELLTLPHLRHVRLGNPNSDGSEEVNTATILRRLTLPALETLFLSTLDIPDDDFTSFLVRSSPPLQSLYISMIEDELTGMDFLHFIPGLNDFTLRFRYYSDREIPMLETIASGRSLPKLRHFTIRDWLLYDRDQESMIDALSSRHTHTLDSEQLESFRLILLGRPKDDLILAWRELAKDRGMNIHVGSLEENYIQNISLIRLHVSLISFGPCK